MAVRGRGGAARCRRAPSAGRSSARTCTPSSPTPPPRRAAARTAPPTAAAPAARCGRAPPRQVRRGRVTATPVAAAVLRSGQPAPRLCQLSPSCSTKSILPWRSSKQHAVYPGEMSTWNFDRHAGRGLFWSHRREKAVVDPRWSPPVEAMHHFPSCVLLCREMCTASPYALIAAHGCRNYGLTSALQLGGPHDGVGTLWQPQHLAQLPRAGGHNGATE